MTGHEFIFSEKPVKRLYRHFLFWLILTVHFIIQNLITGGNVHEALLARSLTDSGINALFFFPIYILSVYIFIKILLPLYLSRRSYMSFLLLVAGLLLFDFAACSFSGKLYLHFVLRQPFDKITFSNNRYNVIVNGLFLPIIILGIIGGIKFAKNWYKGQKLSERLTREKISKELQLLKNQLHPRFLFYSLHAVKKHILSQPLLAANLMLQLSDLLSYILYESDREWVSLDKEIEIIKSYIELQKKSSANELQTEIAVSGDTPGKRISPLLLLSFIENAFDSLLQENQEGPSLHLAISVKDAFLHYQLCCTGFSARQADLPDIKDKFINPQKQLHFSYPHTHTLEITSTPESVTIQVTVPLNIKMFKNTETTPTINQINEFL